jgi:AcrR family transcriptional regulator
MDALIALSRTENLDALSVARIAERADINRVTFYAHFSDLDDLIEAAAAGVIEEAGKAMSRPDHADSEAFHAIEDNLRAFLAKAEEGRTLFAWIGRSSRRARLHDLVFRSMRGIAAGRTEALGGRLDRTAALVLDYVAAGCARLLLDYLVEVEAPPAEIREEFFALLPRLWLPSIYKVLEIREGEPGA